MDYRNKRALVTGGLGFIGSNLAIRLVELGARVTIVDSARPGCGANLYNIEAIAGDVTLIRQDIADAEQFRGELRSTDVVFNLAGEVSHVHSMDVPERDLEINTVSQLRFLEVLRREAPGVRIVYASTRQVYGVPRYLPVDENHPIDPVDFNGVHKYAATMYHLMLSNMGYLDGVSLCLTNVYGPRMALDIPCQGFLSTFLRRVLLGEDIEVFGDGSQLRDPVYVNEAVGAFLAAGAAQSLPSRVYNVGGPEVLSVGRIAEICARAGGSRVSYRPFPKARKEIDIGSYYSDSSRIERELGWKAQTHFEEGLARTLDYFKDKLSRYLDPGRPNGCRMPEHAGQRRRLALIPVS